MEGRDIGTVIFPKANIKIFLDASLEERAMRRCKGVLLAGMLVLSLLVGAFSKAKETPAVQDCCGVSENV